MARVGGRKAPTVPKAGVTRNGKRRYGCGGKIKTPKKKS